MYPELVLGLSDHTSGHTTVLGAVALGARIIEKHFTDDVNREGPDHAFSMNPRSWKEMVDRTRELEQALGRQVKRVEDNESATVIVQRRAIRANADLQRGTIITRRQIAVLRPCPGDAIPPYEIDHVVGRRLLGPVAEGECIRWSDLA
jgi:N-acetylneuraminate synthase